MTKTPRQPLLSLLAVCALFSGTAAAQDLNDLLSSQRYSEAFEQARSQPATQVITQLERYARGNDAPVQWIVADAYWRAGQKEKAIQWGYTALVSTQLDASGCYYSKKVVPWMMQSYEHIFRESNRRPDIQSAAIKSALSWHAAIRTLPSDQAWACRLGVHLDGTRNQHALRMPSDQTLERRRASELKSLIKNAKLQIDLAGE